MSKRDLDILNAASLTQSAVARVLGCKPQAVSQGISRESDYFNQSRIIELFEFFSTRQPETASALALYLPETYRLTISETDPLKVQPLIITGSTEQFKLSHLWIFSSEPFELTDTRKLIKVEQEYYLRPELSITYFVPPGVAQSLRGLLNNVFIRLHKQWNNPDSEATFAHVEIVECPAVLLVPHFSIANPVPGTDGSEPRGSLLDTQREVMVDLPATQVKRIVNVLLAHGVGTDPDSIVSRQHGEPNVGDLSFRAIFSSRHLG